MSFPGRLQIIDPRGTMRRFLARAWAFTIAVDVSVPLVVVAWGQPGAAFAQSPTSVSARRDYAASIASEMFGQTTSLDPETVRNTRSLHHAGAVASGLDVTPTHNPDTGMLEMPTTEELSRGDTHDRSIARSRVAKAIGVKDHDPVFTDLAIEVDRERALNENEVGDSGSILSKSQILDALRNAVMDRRRNG